MKDKLQVEVVESLAGVTADEWDSLVGENDPFLEHGFLRALEVSESVGKGTGWLPCHVLARCGSHLVGAVPLYLKDNSYGEYIFDWGWADASHRAGIPYYPKLVSAVPFTPVTGRRILVGEGSDENLVMGALLDGIRGVAEQYDAHSIHFLFITAEETTHLVDSRTYLPRLTYQYHWSNKGFTDFDDYLAGLRSVSRKQIRRERRRAEETGLSLSFLRGDALDDETWDCLYRFYFDTAARKGAIPYLKEAFFQEIRSRIPHRVMVARARKGDRSVAASLFFQKGNRLLGRYWGCEDLGRDVHFELCYYRPIAFCIDNHLQTFEAGAQGSHKIKRGLLPSGTYSAHWIQHSGMHEAIEAYLRRETSAVQREMRFFAEHGPFKRED